MIFVALHSEQYNSPVFSFFGQAYNTTDGARIFVGQALILIEVYNDTNGNGILDANYTLGSSELKYAIIMNSSVTFDATSVVKSTESGITHYKWGLKYGVVDGIMAAPGATTASRVLIDHVAFSYDYAMDQNVTYLKASYQIGRMTLTEPTYLPNITLQGLSLSLLYSTVILSPRDYGILAGNVTVNSTQSGRQMLIVNQTQVKLGAVTAYEFRFGDNYTLSRGQAQEYPALYVASTRDSIPFWVLTSGWFEPINRVRELIGNSLPELSDIPTKYELNYTSSSFIYRISYPEWSGYPIDHDPTYIANYLPLLSMFPIWTVLTVTFAGVVALALALRRLPRMRKRPEA